MGHTPPLGLLSLAACARKHVPGVSIRIVDAAAQSLSISETVNQVIESGPNIVGITVTTMVANIAQEIAKQIKKVLPHTKTIAGGPHISGVGRDCLLQLDAFDLAAVGEGEQTFVELLEAFKNDGEPGNIAGVIFRDAKGQVHQTVKRNHFDDLSVLPFPAWDLLGGFPRAYATSVFFSPRGPAASLITSRGCPFNCAFCDQSTFGHQYRAASAEYVYNMVKSLQEGYKIRYVMFCDDTFTINRQRVLEICRMLRELNSPIRWSCDANVMTVDREMLLAMKRAGCWSISYGLESGSPKVLSSLNKKITLDRARDAVCQTHAAGIHTKGLFILGTPEESLETIGQTQEFIDSVPLSTINISKFTPYPGSDLYSQVSDDFKADNEQLNGMNFVLPSKYMSIPELEEQYGTMLHRFYGKIHAYRIHLPIMLGCWEKIRRLVSIAPDAVRARIGRSAKTR